VVEKCANELINSSATPQLAAASDIALVVFLVTTVGMLNLSSDLSSNRD
jgi:hypothetical protein